MKLSVHIYQTTSNLWYLHSWREAEKDALPAGNFTAIGLFDGPDLKTAGQTCWVELGVSEIGWIQQLNINSYKGWNWACGKDGKIYLTNADGTVRWPRICLGSPDDAESNQRNMVQVLEETWNAVRIAAIPHGQFIDKPWLVQTSYLVTTAGYTNDVPWYKMPLFDPASGYKVSMGNTGLWLEKKWLHSRV